MNQESNWKECVETHSSIKVSPDIAKAKSLMDTAVGRNVFLSENKVEESTANYIFEGYYSSALEMLHALIIMNGYKVVNHICLGYYLRDVLDKNDLFRLFDECRFKRNSLIYYGRKMDFATAKEAISKCKKLAEELNNLVNHEVN